MTAYKTRHISYKETLSVGDWKVKVYTISKTKAFAHEDYYAALQQQLPVWLAEENGFDDTHNNIAFLIMHAGSEGIFSIINWWVGSNMLNSNIYITADEKVGEFKKISGSGLAPCIWELEVINYERVSWLDNVLKNAAAPAYDKYLADTISVEI